MPKRTSPYGTDLFAPEGKFRAVWTDTFDDSDGVLGDFDTIDEAKKAVDNYAGEMAIGYVYDDQGNYLYDKGTY